MQEPAAGPPTPASGLTAPFTLTRLTVVRHGQSTANAAFADAARTRTEQTPLEGRDADVPLSGLGLTQADALGRWLGGLDPGERPQLVVCSPYARARRTWERMAAASGTGGGDLPHAVVDQRLRDREMGVFELHPPAAIAARAPEEAARRARLGEWFYRPPGGESLADVVLRVRDLLHHLDRAAVGRRILLVAHDAIAVAVQHVTAGIGAPVPDDLPPVPNASVTRWHGDGHHLSLTEWAGTGHLDEYAD
ncbi:histidine phosphatase family protein [Streptomyces sp. PTM05]|uniref:Histidine phosphatase family protein n=1 Tax=Streptantibioticus parmotrematis TaxID=2873249 RepID=A0ABS7QQ87_9ACTN|nr:histidine phosphatase family protein [Streptantibioticus parmotrematis]MBY8885340.1 histidine phosphatase family protein [Streptantibioticus parmotrematis]